MIYIYVFIYADEMEDYIEDRGDLMFDMYKLPFPLVLNNEELVENIMQFDEGEVKKSKRIYGRNRGFGGWES